MGYRIQSTGRGILVSLFAIMILCFAVSAFAATPIAVDDPNEETYEDTLIDINVLANDTMGDLPTVIDAVGTPWDGTVTYDDNSITYTPDPNSYGFDTFNYRIRDNDGETSIAWVTVNVISVNDAPDAGDDTGTVAEADTLNVSEVNGLLNNDTDVDGNTLTVNLTPITAPSNGDLTLNANGSYIYMHDGGETVSDSFVYAVIDGHGGTDTATVNITITPVNDDPIAWADTASVSEGDTLNVIVPGLLANDTDPDLPGDTLIVNTNFISSPNHGNLTLNADGSYEYIHDGSETTSDSFVYEVIDGHGGTDTATVDITIMPDNDNPVAVDDTDTVYESYTLNVAAPGLLDNDWDPDVGDSLTVNTTPVSGPSNGNLTLNADGSYEYKHNGGESTSDFFEYQINDGNGGTDTATVSITINPVNDAPEANDDSYTTDEDVDLTTIDAGVLGNDIDTDGPSMTMDVVTEPNHGTLFPNSNGNFVYYPDTNYNGSDSFTYRVYDGTLYSTPATVFITINPVNDDPEANDDTTPVDEGATLNIAAPGILENDSDLDWDLGATDLLTVNTTPVTPPINGNLTLNADGSYEYKHNGGESTSDFFEYQINDGNGGTDTATVFITINPVNDAPEANDDTTTVDEGATLNIAAPGILNNDTDVDLPADTLTVNTIPVTPPTHGTLTLNADGFYRYIHDGTETTSDSFVYELLDGNGGTATATVAITITPMNDDPVAVDNTGSVTEGGTLNVPEPGLLSNDTDPDLPGDTLIVNSTPVISPSHGGLTLHTDGSYIYTHDGTETTNDSFVYRVSDGNGGTATATVAITITPMNDDPVAVDDTGSVTEGGTLNVPEPGLLSNDTDPDLPGDTLIINSTPVISPSHGGLTLHTDGSYIYTHDGTETTNDSFVYRVSDGNGGTATATVNIIIGLVNEPPIALDDPNYSTAEDSWLTVAVLGVLANDSDPDGDTLTMVVVTGGRPRHGDLYENPEGSFIYISDDDFNGTDTFIYRAYDGIEYSMEATVTITITPLNDPPVAVDDSGDGFNVNEDTSDNTLDVLANDQDSDLGMPIDTLTIMDVGMADNCGTVVNNGTNLTYSPAPDFAGDETFTYTIQDVVGESSTATVTVTVSNVNDAPIANDDAFTVIEDSSNNTLNVLGNDTDVDTGDTLTIISVGAACGTVVNNGTNLTYIPVQGFVGTEGFTYEINDGNGGTDSASITVTVDPLNATPAFDSMPVTGAIVNVSYNYRISATDDDIEDTLTFSGTVPDWLTLTDNGDRTAYLYGTPSDADLGDYFIELTVADDNSSDTQVFTITAGVQGLIAQDNWELLYVDSEELVGTYKPAINSFDGDPATFWHTQWYPNSIAHPHEIQIALGAVYAIDGFRYLPRPDSGGGADNGMIKDYEFYVSLNGSDWGSPVATGTFAKDYTEKEVLFPRVSGQYIRLVALREVNDNPWTTMAEINLIGGVGDIGPGNSSPDGVILSPTEDISIFAGEEVDFQGTGTDLENDIPLSYLWNFGDPTISDSTVADPNPVQFNISGSYTVTFTVIDGMMLADPTPATRTITVISNATIIDQTGWGLLYVDSEEVINTYKPAVYAFDDDPNTIWHTEWNDALHPHEIQIDLGDVYDIEGFYYLPREISENGRIKDYEFYVGGDGVTWGSPIAAGTFPNTDVEQEVLFASTRGRYIRLVALSEVNDNPWTSMAELNILAALAEGTNFPPNGVIVEPAGDVTISVGETFFFAGTGTDSENDTPFTYLWNFDDPDITDFNAATGEIQFFEVGIYTVTFTVTDSAGLPDPTPAIRTITVGDVTIVLPKNDWSLLYVDSEEVVATYKPAINAFDGNPTTIWHTQFSPDSPGYPHEIQINLGKVYDIDGFRYLPRPADPLHGGENGVIKDFEFYVSLDGIDWGSPRATGTFAPDNTEKQVLFSRVKGAYIRLVALSEINDNPWTTMAELTLLGNNIYSSLAFTPTSATVAASGTVNFSATLGEPPYVFSFVDNQSGGSIDPDTGLYTAGTTINVTDSVQLQDSTLYTVETTVYVTGPVAITPTTLTLPVGGTKDFGTIGGVPPFTFSFVDNQSDGTIDSNSGLYTAGAFGGQIDIVRVTDAVSTTSDAFISVVSTPLLIWPKETTVVVNDNVTFTATGGLPPYTFSMVNNESGGSIDPDGTYMAGTTSSATDTVIVTDSADSTSSATVTVSAAPLDQSGWTVYFVDSEAGIEGQASYRPAEYAFDGDSSTIWHTEWADASHPHEIQIDFGDVYEIEGFRYLPRQDGSNGRIGQFQFYVSSDGANWSDSVASGFFVNDAKEQEVIFSTVNCRYIRIVALTEVNGNPWTSIAEINVLGDSFSGNYAPDGVITSPGANMAIQAGDSISFNGTGTDWDGNLPLAYHWTFDGVHDDVFVPEPGNITFTNPGTYVVRLTVADSLGREDSNPATRIVKVRNGDDTISQDNWTLVSVSSEELIGVYKPAVNAFDGDSDTFWHTEWYEITALPPHEITLNLGSAYLIDAFWYLPRQDWVNGRINDYEFYVSSDGKDWGSPVTTGTFADDYSDKGRLFIPKMGQFVKLVALSATDGGHYIATAEINFEGKCDTPYVRIIDPDSNDVQRRPDLVITTSVCLNQDIHNGWGVKFVVDGLTEQVITLPLDGIIQQDTFKITYTGLTLDNHLVEAFIVDDQGVEVSGEMTYDVSSNVGIGDYYVVLGDSISAGFGDDDLSDNTSLDQRNYGGGYAPILNDLLTAAKGYPHTVVKDAINGEMTAEALARLPETLDKHPHAGYFLIQYGTNDSISTLPSGLGLLPGQSGYEGSYKDLMQQIISLITDAGKTAYPAKCPYTGFPDLNDSLQQYNAVIDELALANGIEVAPPDFYSYFEQHYPDEFFDPLHPNGVGYQSMADLWFDAIMNPLP